MAIYDDILADAIEVRNNVNPSSNTAQLVGGVLVDIVNALQQLAAASGMAGRFTFTTTNHGNTTSVTIPAATHGCGEHPIVQCYINGALVQMDVTNSNGDITISWAHATDVSVAYVLVVAFSMI